MYRSAAQFSFLRSRYLLLFLYLKSKSDLRFEAALNQVCAKFIFIIKTAIQTFSPFTRSVLNYAAQCSKFETF